MAHDTKCKGAVRPHPGMRNITICTECGEIWTMKVGEFPSGTPQFGDLKTGERSEPVPKLSTEIE